MKKINLLMVSVVALLLFSACGREVHTYLPTSMWQLVDDNGRPYSTVFTFSGAELAVLNAVRESEPFTDGVYEYSMNDRGDKMEVVFYEDVLIDDEVVPSYVSYHFDVEMSDASGRMTLTHHYVIGRDCVLHLVRQ